MNGRDQSCRQLTQTELVDQLAEALKTEPEEKKIRKNKKESKQTDESRGRRIKKKKKNRQNQAKCFITYPHISQHDSMPSHQERHQSVATTSDAMYSTLRPTIHSYSSLLKFFQ